MTTFFLLEPKIILNNSIFHTRLWINVTVGIHAYCIWIWHFWNNTSCNWIIEGIGKLFHKFSFQYLIICFTTVIEKWDFFAIAQCSKSAQICAREFSVENVWNIRIWAPFSEYCIQWRRNSKPVVENNIKNLHFSRKARFDVSGGRTCNWKNWNVTKIYNLQNMENLLGDPSVKTIILTISFPPSLQHIPWMLASSRSNFCASYSPLSVTTPSHLACHLNPWLVCNIRKVGYFSRFHFEKL